MVLTAWKFKIKIHSTILCPMNLLRAQASLHECIAQSQNTTHDTSTHTCDFMNAVARATFVFIRLGHISLIHSLLFPSEPSALMKIRIVNTAKSTPPMRTPNSQRLQFVAIHYLLKFARAFSFAFFSAICPTTRNSFFRSNFIFPCLHQSSDIGVNFVFSLLL